jgi:hypothetical protein
MLIFVSLPFKAQKSGSSKERKGFVFTLRFFALYFLSVFCVNLQLM